MNQNEQAARTRAQMREDAEAMCVPGKVSYGGEGIFARDVLALLASLEAAERENERLREEIRLDYPRGLSTEELRRKGYDVDWHRPENPVRKGS